MDFSRSIGTGIVMIIPSFVGGGAMWELFNDWGAVFAWLVFMIVTYGIILYKGHYSKK